MTTRIDGSTRFELERFPYKDVTLEFTVTGKLKRSLIMDAFSGAGCPQRAAHRVIDELEERGHATRPVSKSVNLHILQECLDGSGVRFEQVG